MLAALLRYPLCQRVKKAKEWGKAAQKQKIKKDLTLETLNWRLKQDRKGKVYRFGKTYQNNKEINWEIRYSIKRSDQFDVFVNGKFWNRGGKRKLKELNCPIIIK